MQARPPAARPSRRWRRAGRPAPHPTTHVTLATTFHGISLSRRSRMLGLCWRGLPPDTVPRAHSLHRPGHQTPCLRRQLTVEKRSEYYRTRRAVLNCSLQATSTGEYCATVTLSGHTLSISNSIYMKVFVRISRALTCCSSLALAAASWPVCITPTTHVMLTTAAMASH